MAAKCQLLLISAGLAGRGLKAESFSSQQQLQSHSVFVSCSSSLDATLGQLPS